MVDALPSINKSCANNFFAKRSNLLRQTFQSPALDPMREGTIHNDLQHQTADANRKGNAANGKTSETSSKWKRARRCTAVIERLTIRFVQTVSWAIGPDTGSHPATQARFRVEPAVLCGGRLKALTDLETRIACVWGGAGHALADLAVTKAFGKDHCWW